MLEHADVYGQLLIHGPEMTRHKRILSAIIHAHKFCRMLEEYIN